MVIDRVKHLPYIIKKPAKIIYNYIPDIYKYGKKFRKSCDFLQESQYWSKEKLENYQLEQLHKVIEHAYNNVPYYNRVFNERGLAPKDIKDFNDLKKLPYLTKDIVRENMNELIATNYDKKKLKYVTTGGTTGKPMSFYVQRDNYIRERAFVAMQFKRVGYSKSRINRMVILTGYMPHHGYYEYIGKDLILSSFLLNKDNFMEYIRKIEKFNPYFIQAYPSTIAVLSKYILQNEIIMELSKIKAILCSSENIYDYQRKMIEDAFNCRVYGLYGHREACCIAGTCEKSDLYHIQSEYGFAELINKGGKDAVRENELCEIVATGFNNYSMPFIRYRTGDIAVNTSESCGCGRNYKLIKKIYGREREFFVDENGSPILMMRDNEGIWSLKHMIIACQYVQNEAGKVLLNIVANGRLNNEDKLSIVEDFHKSHPTLDITLKEVDDIPKTNIGKYISLVQNLDIHFNLKAETGEKK